MRTWQRGINNLKYLQWPLELFTKGSCFVCVQAVQQRCGQEFVSGWRDTHIHTHIHRAWCLGLVLVETQGLAFNLSVLQGISLHFWVHTDTKIERERWTDGQTGGETMGECSRVQASCFGLTEPRAVWEPHRSWDWPQPDLVLTSA